MVEELRRKRDHAVQRFLDEGLRGTLYVPLSADDLLDGDLYWESSPLVFVAKQTVLVLDETVATIDGAALLVCLRELKELGFSFAVPDDMTPYQSTSSTAEITGTGASTWAAREGTSRRSSRSLPA